ncbi:hypothetical protein, partial [Mycolicibacterium fortuitum]|uniref:hypothetical protein n=1 Tax=Mycolicibacterium fortuitum TaxID=1766 RepID=UPI00105497DE
MSDERYDPSATVQVATVAAPAGPRPARVGYVPTRTNRVRADAGGQRSERGDMATSSWTYKRIRPT